MKKTLTVAVAAAVLLVPVASATTASAATTPHYANCKAMNNGKYPHGVGKKGARDKTSGRRVTTFKVDSKVYYLFSAGKAKTGYYDLDRDNDGIACEKR